jgi:DNA-binding response OmpR family regulator
LARFFLRCPPENFVSRVPILVIDDDTASRSALKMVLDAEGWSVTVVPIVREGLAHLAQGNWKLVIVNVAMIGLDSPLFLTLKELAHSRTEEGQPRVGVLFLVPELAAWEAKPALEQERLPYVLKPFHLHDFLERVSDVLLEVKAIENPIRQVRAETDPALERRRKQNRRGGDRRSARMFASRDDYFMTEEEIAEYERQEAEARRRKDGDDKDFL